jgi:hypothetical protein
MDDKAAKLRVVKGNSPVVLVADMCGRFTSLQSPELLP